MEELQVLLKEEIVLLKERISILENESKKFNIKKQIYSYSSCPMCRKELSIYYKKYN
jgi:hypothetical protein